MSTKETQVFGHPKGLFYLFFAELWERFSFYGMRALLVLYMTKHLLYDDDMSFGIFAAYMSLVYVTPLIGGIIADKIIGYRKAIVLGGVLMSLGHLLLTIELPIFFYGSLALIIVGNGFFKPNISSFVGDLYHKEDSRRDAGFTIFYMGINIGAAIAPLLCAWFASTYGWHYGFVLAGFGMILGLLIFKKGISNNVFYDKGLVSDPNLFNKKNLGVSNGKLVTIGAFLSVPLFAIIIKFHKFEHYLVWVISFFLIAYLSYIFKQVSKKEKKRLLVIVYFTLLYTLFAAIFEQAGSSLTLFADRNVNLIGMDAAGTNSINAGFIFILAIPFSMLWTYLNNKNINPNSAIKFGIGLLLLGLGFVVFAYSANAADSLAQTPMFYLVLGYLILTIGELFLSPIGLSKMTELSPLKYLAFIMGVWFSANFYGHFFAGKIAKLTASTTNDNSFFSDGIFRKINLAITGIDSKQINELPDAFSQLYSYVSVYATFGTITIIVGIFAITISPFIKKLMDGVH